MGIIDQRYVMCAQYLAKHYLSLIKIQQQQKNGNNLKKNLKLLCKREMNMKNSFFFFL